MKLRCQLQQYGETHSVDRVESDIFPVIDVSSLYEAAFLEKSGAQGLEKIEM